MHERVANDAITLQLNIRLTINSNERFVHE